jgi:hypothetical protein
MKLEQRIDESDHISLTYLRKLCLSPLKKLLRRLPVLDRWLAAALWLAAPDSATEKSTDLECGVLSAIFVFPEIASRNRRSERL